MSFCLECHPKDKLPEKKSHKELFSAEGPKEKTCTDCHAKKHRLEVRTRRWDKATGKLLWDDGVRMMEERPKAEE